MDNNDSEYNKALNEALTSFKKQYKLITSGDIQTFIIAFTMGYNRAFIIAFKIGYNKALDN